MNRRQFNIAVGMTLAAGTLPISGCINVKSLANDFIASLTAIVAADPTASYVAVLNEAIASLKLAVAGWNGTTVNCALQSAANIAVGIIDQIDPGSPVALVATVALAGFDVLMANLAPCTAPAPTVAHKFSNTHLRGTGTYVVDRNKIQSAWFQQHAFRSVFNDAAKTSGLTVRI